MDIHKQLISVVPVFELYEVEIYSELVTSLFCSVFCSARFTHVAV